jgi:hypothetical protein
MPSGDMTQAMSHLTRTSAGVPALIPFGLIYLRQLYARLSRMREDERIDGK